MTVVVFSKTDFPSEIEELVKTKKVSYLDAVLLWCANRGLEEMSGGELVKKHPQLKKKIQAEAKALFMLKAGKKK